MIRKALLLLAAITIFSCADKNADLPDGLYANIETNKGNIIARLEFEKTPVTVANFITLAEGTNVFVDEPFRGKKFYDGLRFHRVIQNFMIQGGDPLGNGSGDAGYKFKDEITDLQHDKAGILSMANSGPGTNSSQFFITHKETSWLDGKHTVFGQVVEGIENVNKIVQDDGIISITIIRNGEAAKKFDAVKTFNNYFRNAAEEKKKADAEAQRLKDAYVAKYKAVIESQLASFNALKEKAIKTNSGLRYIITKEGSGKKPVDGSRVQITYSGFLEDGTLFDTSSEDVAARFGVLNEERAKQNAYQPLPFIAGTKTGLFPGFIEGVEKLSLGDKAVLYIPSHLALGQTGSGNGVIPPNANLIFEVELIKQ